MGYSPIDKIPIALCKVAVNNVYDMSTSLSFLLLFCAPNSTARNRIIIARWQKLLWDYSKQATGLRDVAQWAIDFFQRCLVILGRDQSI